MRSRRERAPSFALVLLLVGLPIVTATAVVQEGIPRPRGEYADVADPNELEGRTPEEVHMDPSDPSARLPRQRRLWTSYTEIVVGDAAWGVRHAEEGIRDGTWDALAPLERSQWFTGLNLVYGGDAAGARRVADDLAVSLPERPFDG